MIDRKCQVIQSAPGIDCTQHRSITRYSLHATGRNLVFQSTIEDHSSGRRKIRFRQCYWRMNKVVYVKNSNVYTENEDIYNLALATRPVVTLATTQVGRIAYKRP